MNSTSTTQNEKLKQLIETFLRVQITSGIFLVVVSFVTVVGNGLLLLAIWKDPFKTFRTPTTFFVIGLATADFLTGIAVCPIYVLQNIGYYLGVKNRDPSMFPLLQKAGKIAQTTSVVTMNSSYIILLLFTWSQFTAINFPYKHRVFVTKNRVVACVILTWIYTIAFAILSASGVAQKVFFKMDLYFHTTGSLLLLMIAYFCLYKAFKKQMMRLHSLNANNTLGEKQRRRRRNRKERQFTVVNLLLLTFVIVCTLPITIVFYVYIHWKANDRRQSIQLQIASLISTNVLFLKFALDPLIYAWRLSQYRRALKSLLVCRRQRIHIDDALSLTLDNQTAASCRQRALNGDVVEIGHGFTVVWNGWRDRG